MFEWVPSAICFVFGHVWYVPEDSPNYEHCRRCPATQPTMDQRIIDAYEKSRESWKAKGWIQ